MVEGQWYRQRDNESLVNINQRFNESIGKLYFLDVFVYFKNETAMIFELEGIKIYIFLLRFDVVG